MNWQLFFTNLLLILGGNGGLVLALTFLFRNIITNHYTRENEIHKNKLARELEQFKIQANQSSNQALENLKNSLKMIEVEHQVKFNKLHETRASVINELYSKFSVAYRDVELFILEFDLFGGLTKLEKLEKSNQSFSEFVNLFNVNRIYFNENICNQVDEIINEIDNIKTMYHFYRFESMMEERMEDIQKINQRIKEKVAPMKKQLESEFRNILEAKSIISK